MNKSSEMWLIILTVLAMLGAYQSLFPVTASIGFIRFFGLAAFFLLCASLLIGPLVTFWPAKYAQLIEPRRAVGISAFVFLAMHIILVMALELNFSLDLVLSSFSLIISAIATIIFLALVITSNNKAIKMLGLVNWKNLQRLSYIAFVLVFIHFILNSNGLLTQAKGLTFLNLGEAGMIILGMITVIAQLLGFYHKMKLKSAIKPSVPAVHEEEKKQE